MVLDLAKEIIILGCWKLKIMDIELKDSKPLGFCEKF